MLNYEIIYNKVNNYISAEVFQFLTESLFNIRRTLHRVMGQRIAKWKVQMVLEYCFILFSSVLFFKNKQQQQKPENHKKTSYHNILSISEVVLKFRKDLTRAICNTETLSTIPRHLARA